MSAAASPCLDLRGTPCPLNYIRSRLALEALASGDRLEILLDRGEPEQMVSEGLSGEGHRVDPQPAGASDAWVRLIVERDGGIRR
ncbi:MAG: sulfurtransferase TusA family protein [Synechococcaceae cyanobacterium]|nr:sulfurtransferase TusA family protein [Synechococcaceae cyanobacterium]